MLWRIGFSILLIDLRGVGDSDSGYGWSPAGSEEYADELGAWDCLVATKGLAPNGIGLFGVSLGGATAVYPDEFERRLVGLFRHAQGQ